MGVTIHFHGRLKDEQALETVLAAAAAFAEQRGWQAERIDVDRGVLRREIDWVETSYEGPVRGLVVYPHEWCEPLRLEFDERLFCQDWVKTQYAPIDVHTAIATLFHDLAPHFSALDVNDEGGFFSSGDATLLAQHIAQLNRTLAELLAEAPQRRGPVKLPSGRIADVVG